MENKDNNKKGKGLIIILLVVILILVLGYGIVIGFWASGKLVLNSTNTSNNTNNTTAIKQANVSRIEHESCSRPDHDGTFYILITAYDDSGKEVWTYKTEEGATAQYLDLNYIGENNGRVYVEECGTIVALNRENGEVVWKNDEYKGFDPDTTFDSNGNIYLCSRSIQGSQPLFIINTDGKTLLKDAKTYGWFDKIDINEAKKEATIYYHVPGYGTYENQEIIVKLNLSDYTYTTETIDPEYKYDENGYIILIDYSGISSFWGKWESIKENDTEIVISQDEIFLMDHYTRSSEIAGDYTIHADKITFSTDGGLRTWEGQLLADPNNGGAFVLKVKIDGEDKIFKCTDTNSKILVKMN